MNKLSKLLFTIPIILTGCKSTVSDVKLTGQSVDNLNMNIFSDEGKKLYTIKSPNSIYSKEKNVFNLKKTTINLYKDNKTEYIINSDNSELSNNNKLLKLNGNVRVKTLIQQGDKLYSNSFKWNIQNSEYLLLGDVKFENESISLSSNKAILNNDISIIEFFNPVKYRIKDGDNKRAFEIISKNAYYNIYTKTLSFKSLEERVRSKIYF